MKIYKFQNGTKDYGVGILYSTHGEEYRLQSDDKPQSELYLHAASVVFLAEEYFGLKGLRAELKEIVFSSGQNGPQTKVTLNVLTSQTQFAKMQLPKIDRSDIENPKTHEVDPMQPRNAYNLAVDLLEGSIVSYVQGRRQQAVLDFEAEKERTMQDECTRIIELGDRLSARGYDEANDEDDEDDDDDSESTEFDDVTIGRGEREIPFPVALQAAAQ